MIKRWVEKRNDKNTEEKKDRIKREEKEGRHDK